MEFPPSYGCIDTSEWLHSIGANEKCQEKKARWALLKNAACNTLQNGSCTATYLSSHLINHPSKANKTYQAFQKKQRRTNKWRSLMDSYRWTHQYWLSTKDLHPLGANTGWWERVWELGTVSLTWWWWWWWWWCVRLYHTSSLIHRDGSSGMFPMGSRGGGGSDLTTSDPLAQMTQLALILLQLPSWQLNCPSTQDKWPQKWLYHFKFYNSQSELGSSDDFWIFPLKSGGHFALAFRPRWHLHSAICSLRYVVFCFVLFFSSFFFPPFFLFLPRNLQKNKIK